MADVEQAQLWELRSLQGRRSELLPQVRAVFGDDSPHGRCLQAMILLERGDRAAAEAVAAPLLDSAAPAVFPADRSWTLAATFASELAAALEARPACQWLYDELTPLAAGAAVVGVAIALPGCRRPLTWACWPRPWAGPRRPGATSSGPWPSTTASARAPGP